MSKISDTNYSSFDDPFFRPDPNQQELSDILDQINKLDPEQHEFCRTHLPEWLYQVYNKVGGDREVTVRDSVTDSQYTLDKLTNIITWYDTYPLFIVFARTYAGMGHLRTYCISKGQSPYTYYQLIMGGSSPIESSIVHQELLDMTPVQLQEMKCECPVFTMKNIC